jgi:hypothetical protein
MAYDPKTHEFDGDQLQPKHVLEHIQAHDNRMEVGSPDWALAKAMYMTMYWAYRNTGSNIRKEKTRRLRDIDVEVNRIWPIIGTYLAALYPRANRTVMGPDPTGRGEAKLAEKVVNYFLGLKRIHQRIMDALRQGILYPGCGAKLGHNPGTGTAIERTWMRVIPWWELLLDFDVNDPDDQRFIGHLYFKSKHEAEREYDVEDLKGCGREDFLSQSGRLTEKQESNFYSDQKAPSDQDAFVRVLELCNLVDTIEVNGRVFQGRLEIYILDQDGWLGKYPVFMGPMPFARPDGTALPHIVPLIFNYEPEFPLRGIAHSARMLPQMRELNHYRSFLAMASRKDTRQYLAWKGVFDSESLEALTDGEDGLVLEVDPQYWDKGRLEDALVPVKNAPVSQNIHLYTRTVEDDLDRIVGHSPNARGDITKGTAYEVRNVQFYTESEFGMHAMIKDQWLASLVYLILRVIVDAMQTIEGYRGEFEDEEGVDLAVEDARPGESEDIEEAEEVEVQEGEDEEEEDTEEDEDEDEDGAKDVAGMLSSDISGQQQAYVGEEAQPPWSITEDEGRIEIIQETLTIEYRDENVEVSVEDLDAEFDISFVEGGRTPMADAQMQQNLVALAELYFKLWDAVVQGGPQGVLAYSYMRAIAERFDLPKDMHPDQLLAEKAEQPEEPEQPQAPAQQPQQAQPTIEDIQALSAEELAQIILQNAGDNPELQDIVQRALALPPNEAHRILAELVAEGLGLTQPPAAEPVPPATPTP